MTKAPATLDIPGITAGIRAGDEAAFNVFCALYGTRMQRYLLVVARGDEPAAQEAYQETLIRIIKYLKPCAGDPDLWRYLTTCMGTVWIDQVRRRQALNRGRRPISSDLALATPPAHADRIDDRLQDLLTAALASLPIADRQLIEDHYMQGLPQPDLAARMELPVKTLGMRLVRVRRHLRELIVKGLQHD